MAEQKFTTRQVLALVSLALGVGGGAVGVGAKVLPVNSSPAAAAARDDARELHNAQLRVLRTICVRLSPDEAAREACRQ